MTRIVQFRRGTTSGLTSILGAPGELFVDTSLVTVVVHDGVTTGGVTLARNADVQNLSSITATNIATLSSVAATRATSSTFGVMRTDGTSLLAVAGLVIPAVSSNGFGARTISTGDPSGGNDGDIWYKYV